MEIGKQIKKYRTEMKLSQEQLSEKAFVSRQTISNWENNKNYPDMKSLVLLSSIFNVSLDILVKGDLEEMRERIKMKNISEEDADKFKRDSNIFAILLIIIIVLPIPVMKFIGNSGLVVMLGIAITGIYYSIRVEKHKKKFNIQTYKEIISFVEDKTMNEAEKNQEYGKRPYQKFLLASGVTIATVIVGGFMSYILL